MKTLVLYMPVLHRGYLQLFENVKPDTICLLSEDVLRGLSKGLEYVWKKDLIRAIPSTSMAKVLTVLTTAKILWADEMLLGGLKGEELIMPEEDISSAVAKKYFGGMGAVTFVTPPSRLRYHRDNVEERKLLVPDRRIPISDIDWEMMSLVDDVLERSPDWYRQVGGVLVTKDGLRIVAYNEHVPHEQIAATFGDPRSIFKSGIRADLSHSDHAEHILIGEAARRKIGTDRSTMYLSTFPCLPCGRLVVRAGVKKLFYRDASYGLLDADEYLRGEKVELIEISS